MPNIIIGKDGVFQNGFFSSDGAFSDDFSDGTLDPEWTVQHYDNTGTVSESGGTLEIDSNGTGDFWNNADGGSFVYIETTESKYEVEVDVTAASFYPSPSQVGRLLQLRGQDTANSRFAVFLFDDDASHITWARRKNDGDFLSSSNPGDYGGSNSGQAFSSFPVRLRFEYDDPNVTWKVSTDGGSTYNTIKTESISGLSLIGLSSSLHAAVTYDNFEFTENP